jgi:type II secretory pathway component PulF
MSFAHPRRDERAAAAMEDLASALDAGLSLGQIMGIEDVETGSGPTAALTGRGVRLGPVDRVILDAAEAAGELAAALRERASTYLRRASLVRQVQAKLRYPCFLILLSLLAAVVVSPVSRAGLTPLAIGGLGPLLLGLVAFSIRLGMGRPNSFPLRLPILGPILRDMGELPYLRTLRGLYGAGIPLLQAHPQAVETVPVAHVRQALERADYLLQGGRSLAEALDAGDALSPETRQILAPGEAAGDLEDALDRATNRRDQTLVARTEHGLRLLTGVIYTLSMVVAVYVIVGFYIGYYGQIADLLGR